MVRLPRPEGNAQDAETASLEPLVSLRQERIEYLNAALRVKQVRLFSRSIPSVVEFRSFPRTYKKQLYLLL
eukprot:5538002-Pyramimonas_sp.AAC.1